MRIMRNWTEEFTKGSSAYMLLQIESAEHVGKRFMNMTYLKKTVGIPKLKWYKIVYVGALQDEAKCDEELLDRLFMEFNYPARLADKVDYEGRSMSVSDVVLIRRGLDIKAWFVDSIGFEEIPGFFEEDGK